MEDGLCVELLDALAAASLPWPALREVSLVGCTLWSDWQGGEVEALEARLAALPGVAAKVAKFEGSCQGMEQGRESFFSHLPALRSLELGERAAAAFAAPHAALPAGQGPRAAAVGCRPRPVPPGTRATAGLRVATCSQPAPISVPAAPTPLPALTPRPQRTGWRWMLRATTRRCARCATSPASPSTSSRTWTPTWPACSPSRRLAGAEPASFTPLFASFAPVGRWHDG